MNHISNSDRLALHAEGSARLVLLGDFCPIGAEIHACAESWRPFHAVRSAMPGAIKLVANLESPITEEITAAPFKWATFRVSPACVGVLDGLDAAILANNHISDYGDRGAQDTVQIIRSRGIASAGYGHLIEDAMRPAFIEMPTGRIGVVAMSCPTTNGGNLATHHSAGVAPLGMSLLGSAVSAARSQCDAVIAFFHWGCEWVHAPVIDQLRLARHAIDCGADAVVGCHSHTIQPYEQYNGRWIFYGLGNFVFGSGVGRETRADGSVVCHPLRAMPANRESLAVAFALVPPGPCGRLRLDRVQAFRQQHDLSVVPVDLNSLSFPLEKLNTRLHGYVLRHSTILADRLEVVYEASMQHGTINFRYRTPPLPLGVDETFRKRVLTTVRAGARAMVPRLFRATLRDVIPRARRSATQAILNSRIKVKWLEDGRHLPLCPDHWELYDILHRAYWSRLRQLPRLVDCVDYNDKIQWLKLFDQQPDVVRCSDKLGLREYAKERGCEAHLPELFQVCDRADDIRFEALPCRFVMKATHDCGSSVLVRDKNTLDTAAAQRRINTALSKIYGWENGEWPYAFVRPRVIIEEYIGPINHVPPPDYKFHMVNGEMRWLQFISDRGSNTKEAIVDPAGRPMPLQLYEGMNHSEDFTPPAEWDQLLQVAAQLARGWKYVRVDLYATAGHVFVGEMTFFPYYGTYKGHGQKQLGQFLDFDRTTFLPPIYRKLGTIPAANYSA